MTNKRPDDPVERLVFDGLVKSGWMFTNDPTETNGLDFKLSVGGSPVYIECKRFYAPRVATQMARANDMIVIQGIEAARLFNSILELVR